MKWELCETIRMVMEMNAEGRKARGRPKKKLLYAFDYMKITSVCVDYMAVSSGQKGGWPQIVSIEPIKKKKY